MLGTEYTTNHGAPWSTLWVMELRLVDLTNEIHRNSLLEYAGNFAVPCVAEALMNVLDLPVTGGKPVAEPHLSSVREG